MDEEMVTITLDEYNELKDDSKFLYHLMIYGVDNWSGYQYAQEDFNHHKEQMPGG